MPGLIVNGVDAVFAASKCAEANVYFIGPYGARVSFASQQRRVLNLLWALHEKEMWPNKPVVEAVVVGGGIAGLMAAAALLARGCTVRILEEKGHFLHLQEAAHHRFIHPTINFWPEQPLEWTTRLPFFDWYAGSCVNVVRTISREWDDEFDGELPRDDYSNTKVLKAKTARDGRVTLKVERRGVAETLTADLVLFATGFGQERSFDDPKQISYWDEDSITKAADLANKRYLVSGTGDGGVIDALRLTYRRFMDDEIALKFLVAIDNEGLRKQVAAIERKAAEEDDLNKRALFYEKEYARVALDRPRRAKDLLPAIPGGKLPVELVGQWDAPFDIGAAPIHKIILAHALAEKQIKFIPGELTRRNKKQYVLTPKVGPAEILDRDRIVVRHGAVPPVKHFIGETAAQALFKNQSWIGDFMQIDGRDPTFFDNEALRLEDNPLAKSFARRRGRMAAEFLQARHGLGASMEEKAEDGSPIIRTYRPPNSSLPINTVGIPESLFGIPIDPVIGDTEWTLPGTRKRRA